MRKLILFPALAALGFLTGCSSGSDNAAAPANGPTVNALVEESATPLTPSGDIFSTSLVVSYETCADEMCAASDDPALLDIYAKHPGLQDDVTALLSIDKVIETTNGTFDLYDGDMLVLTLKTDAAGAWMVAGSATELMIHSISFQTTTLEDQSVVDGINFGLRSCVIQEQEQEGKDETVQEKAPRGEEVVQEQTQEEVKEEVKEEVPVEECAIINVGLFLEKEVIEEKPQEQTQEEVKDEEQAQEEVKDETPQEQVASK